MADVVEEAGFWLPSEFFADDSSVLDEEKTKNGKKNVLASDFCFPTEFPYHFETGKNEFLESLLMSTSPQSTLGNWSCLSAGSPNLMASPPTSPPFTDDVVGELIYNVTGQVAKLKLNSGGEKVQTNHSCFFAPQRSQFLLYPSTPQTPIPSVYQNTRVPLITRKQQIDGCGLRYSPQQVMYHSRGATNPTAWTIPRNGSANFSLACNPTPSSGYINSHGAAVAVKKEYAGTGVFIPRSYSNTHHCNAYSSDSRRKPAPSSFLADRTPRPSKIGCLNGDYDSSMARRNYILSQYQRSLLLEKSRDLNF